MQEQFEERRNVQKIGKQVHFKRLFSQFILAPQT